tara:strand:+ start:1008 stop:1781 length:774 start_codon:yes stop_codon:yes gene_type:complete
MLRRHADKLLINGDYANVPVVAPTATTIDIQGYGIISNTNLVSASKICSAAEVLQVQDVTVVIPTSCECPYEWCLTVVCLPNLQLYETQNTFPSSKVYCYEDPAGGTPVDTVTAAAIAAHINADPFACVTATVVGAVITLTSVASTNGFEVYSSSATIPAPTTAHAQEVLGIDGMTRIFPIHPGDFGSQPLRPNTPNFTTTFYCKWNVVIRGQEDVQDVDGANHWNQYEKEVDIYVWDDNTAAFDTLDAALDLVLGT